MRLRMADEDREKYGGPEELDFADVPDWLDSLGYDDLVAVDDQIIAEFGKDSPLLLVLYQLLTEPGAAISIRMRRTRLWLSLRAAGVELPLADFKPARLYGVKVVRPARDAVPPVAESDSSSISSDTPDEAEPTTTPESGSSTDGSTPGPGAPTE